MYKQGKTIFEVLENRTMMSVSEPNNSLATAVGVDGFGGFGGIATFADAINPSDPVDYYKLNVPMTFYQSFVAKLSGLSADLTLALVHDLNGDKQETANEISVKSTNAGTANEQVASELIPQLGVYYLKVSAANPGVTTAYTLDLSNDTAPDDPKKARPLTPNGAAMVSDALGSGDLYDVYKVLFDGSSSTARFAARLTAPSDSIYHVDLMLDANRNGVFDSGEIVTTSHPANGAQEIAFQNLNVSNSYYLRVLRGATGDAENYLLHTQLDYAGNTPDTAKFLGGPEGRIVSMNDQVGSDSTTSFNDSDDYYKFVVGNTGFTAVSQVNLASDFFPGTSSLTQQIYRDKNNNGKIDSGELIVSGTTGSTTGSSSIRTDLLAPGNYYVRITGTPTPNYTLYLSLDGLPGITSTSNSFSKSKDIGTLDRQFAFADGLGAGDASDTYKFKMPQTGSVTLRLDEQFSQERSPVTASIATDKNRNGKLDSGETLGTFTLGQPLTLPVNAGTYYVTLAGGLHYAIGLTLTPDFAGNSPQKAKDLGTLKTFVSAKDVLTPSPNGDVDYYKFKLASKQTFTANVVGFDSLAKVTITLMNDNNGSVSLVKEITGAPGGKAFLQTDLPAGTYQVLLSVTGISLNYSVGFSAGDNDDAIPEANQNPGSQVFGNGSKDFTIGDKNDVDMIAFYTAPGHQIEIDVDSRNGSNFNSYLRLFDANGNQLANNDDGAAPGESSSKFSYLKYKVPSTYKQGFIYAAVSSASNKNYNAMTGEGDTGGGSTGAYRVTLKDLTGPILSRSAAVFSGLPVANNDLADPILN